MAKKIIKACIFDLDGTVMDSMPIYWSTMEEVAKDKFTPEFKATLNGRLDTEVAEIMAQKYKHFGNAQGYFAARDAILNERLKNCPLVKGIKRIVNKLHDMGIPMAIGTSTPEDAFELKTAKHAEFFKNFKAKVTGSDVKEGKPNPAVFLRALQGIGGDIKPENVLIFEDAYLGCVAAKRAGMNAVMLHADNSNIQESFKQYELTDTRTVESWDEFNFDDYVFEK
ncbi:haloacid dehalogenase-like hydrolase family protein [Trichomonas vaginalis G3]|uniref:Haloacid dehalogenase-like hydrolase family protein n=1 Tax=Trichomonas vaginalis (strain ATCC PRA-98 / G3) TaxID=412133 RepID=A2EFS8_TRIV3|nr:pseudouridine 5'-phosphatase protein [Trichomonas vaginalis G3]EAY08479.1 haloacid dehalogenase-like hydrolase family protein [Trichomonas vaginalis G3]KAI5537764.1 pseudouridine 5'-phosphatase protein [Trichomonas vaginalis G3]|eukprot:XP_001320702.1 haloacid dehalogenase-like hydrolase family protein [Trichomonas vaginalis G3]